MKIPAKYENGVFKPLEDVKIKEGTVVEVYVPSEQKGTGKRRSIKELPFYGMWADRTDIDDGVSYVNRLRDNPRD
jgi:predicted DNA-binding antitoxin AbrB/MazE fold protein